MPHDTNLEAHKVTTLPRRYKVPLAVIELDGQNLCAKATLAWIPAVATNSLRIPHCTLTQATTRTKRRWRRDVLHSQANALAHSFSNDELLDNNGQLFLVEYVSQLLVPLKHHIEDASHLLVRQHQLENLLGQWQVAEKERKTKANKQRHPRFRSFRALRQGTRKFEAPHLVAGATAATSTLTR